MKEYHFLKTENGQFASVYKLHFLEKIDSRRDYNRTIILFFSDIFKVFCADHTYSALKLPRDARVNEVVMHAANKLGLGEDLVLCEVKSSGGQ